MATDSSLRLPTISPRAESRSKASALLQMWRRRSPGKRCVAARIRRWMRRFSGSRQARPRNLTRETRNEKLETAVLRARHLEAVRGARVGCTTHSADGTEFFGIDLEIVDDSIVNVESQNLADDQIAAARERAEFHRQIESALHVDVRLGNSRRLHKVAGDRRQSGGFELVDVRRKFGGTQIHLLREFF